jgi:hypothetical protein
MLCDTATMTPNAVQVGEQAGDLRRQDHSVPQALDDAAAAQLR